MQEIREKNSLAYYINSNILKADNILLIQSGISSNNFKKVISSIKKIMKQMGSEVFEAELNDAKTEYISLLDEVYDNIDSILENYIATNLLNLDSLEKRRENIEKISLDDIKNISKKVKIDTIYLLEDGGEANEEI